MLRSEYYDVPTLRLLRPLCVRGRLLMLSDSAMEYERHTDSYFDPFAELYNVSAPASAFGNGV